MGKEPTLRISNVGDTACWPVFFWALSGPSFTFVGHFEGVLICSICSWEIYESGFALFPKIMFIYWVCIKIQLRSVFSCCVCLFIKTYNIYKIKKNNRTFLYALKKLGKGRIRLYLCQIKIILNRKKVMSQSVYDIYIQLIQNSYLHFVYFHGVSSFEFLYIMPVVFYFQSDSVTLRTWCWRAYPDRFLPTTTG